MAGTSLQVQTSSGGKISKHLPSGCFAPQSSCRRRNLGRAACFSAMQPRKGTRLGWSTHLTIASTSGKKRRRSRPRPPLAKTALATSASYSPLAACTGPLEGREVSEKSPPAKSPLDPLKKQEQLPSPAKSNRNMPLRTARCTFSRRRGMAISPHGASHWRKRHRTPQEIRSSISMSTNCRFVASFCLALCSTCPWTHQYPGLAVREQARSEPSATYRRTRGPAPARFPASQFRNDLVPHCF